MFLLDDKTKLEKLEKFEVEVVEVTDSQMPKLKGKFKRLEYYDEPHQYYLVDMDDRKFRIDGVTSIDKGDKSNQLISWATKINYNYLKDLFEKNGSVTFENIEDSLRQWSVKRDVAGDIGTEVHNLLQALFKVQTGAIQEDEFRKMKDELSKEGKESMVAFSKWFLGTSKEIVASELLVCWVNDDFTRAFATKIDVIYKLLESLLHNLGDYKTGSGIYDDHKMQVVAGEMGVDFTYPGKYEFADLEILRLFKENKYETKEYIKTGKSATEILDDIKGDNVEGWELVKEYDKNVKDKVKTYCVFSRIKSKAGDFEVKCVDQSVKEDYKVMFLNYLYNHYLKKEIINQVGY